MPVPFYAGTVHLGEVAGRAESQDKRKREGWTKRKYSIFNKKKQCVSTANMVTPPFTG